MNRIIKPLAICFFLSWQVACTNEVTPSQISIEPTESISAETPSQNGDSLRETAVSPLQLLEGRAAHTATLLPDGTVLLTGGFGRNEQALASSETFDPATGIFSSAAPLSTPRQSHTATLLPDGKVLIAGGFDGDYLASAEIYDPATGDFRPTGSMTTGRSGQTAVSLQDGKVLLAGGVGEGWTFLATAELYDPETGIFTAMGSMTTARESHTATRLPGGQVLITGGHQGRRAAIKIYASAELYDPDTGLFAATGDMQIKRHKHDATLLGNGRVLISGGSDERDAKGAYRSTEIYDSQENSFTIASQMQTARYKHNGTSLLLPNGQLLLVGGANTAEIYDPPSDTFHKIANGVGTTRLFATATLLPSGEILFAGGYGSGVIGGSQAWILEF